MLRLLGISLLFLGALPASAQSLFADPTVWVSTSFGAITWTEQPLELGDRDNLISNLSVTTASPRWMVQGGVQMSSKLTYFEWDNTDRATYHSLSVTVGPWTQSTWFMAGAAVGPAVTWGTRLRSKFVCDPGDICALLSTDESERYFNPGLAGSVQGFVRLDGRVWLGGETMLVANPSNSHLAHRLALRVDLLRPNR